MLKDNENESKFVVKFKREMLCCGRKKGREPASDIATSPRRQNLTHGVNNTVVIRPKDPPPMIIQGDFRKVSGISNEIFRQIETIENEYDASTAAALETVERRGEMIVRILDTKHLGKAAAEAAKKFLSLQDAKHSVLLVEIIKRPGQTLGLYIREGNGLDRSDGVFISRIALESAVYNSGCIQVGDEILAVNLVDVTRMSIDDVVIIMSIPRRLVLVTRQAKGYPASSSLTLGAVSHTRLPEPKPPPVVVIKKDLSKEDDFDDDEEEKHSSLIKSNVTKDPWRKEKSRSHVTLDSNGDLETDLYYNSRPESQHHQTCTLDRRISGWTYTPQPGALEHYFKQTNHLPMTCDRNYPKTLESLAEKVHPFCPGGSTLGRRTSETALSSKYSHSTLRKTGITRSGSDQHLPRTEHDNFSRTLPIRHSQTLLRSGTRGWSTTAGSNYGSRQGTLPPSTTSFDSSLSRSHRLDYASDNEISYPAVSKSASYYYCRPNTSQAISGISSSTLSRLNKSGALSRAASLRSNSLPRDNRITKNHLTSVSMINPLNNVLSSNVKYGTNARTINNLLDREDDGALSAPELPPADKFRRSNYLNSTSNVFTSDEYRAWLSRTPSTSAIYDKLKYNRESAFLRQKNRFTFSAENIPEKTGQSSIGSIGMTPLPSATVATLDRHTRTSSLRRIRHLQELEAKHLGSRSITPDLQIDRSRVLEINTSEFTKYKLEKTHLSDEYPSISGLLWIHLLAGRGLRVTAAAPPLSGPNNVTRDLYCVLECDRVHKARTVVRNGDLVFDWDETFELDLFSNRELDFLVYSWDPQLRHKLCYKGSIHLCSLVSKSPIHQLALKVEPRGTLYIRLRYTDAVHTYLRRTNRPPISSKNLLSANCLFGVDLETVVNRECESMSSPFDPVLDETSLCSSVPIIIRRCVEEVEKRGLDIIGLYRLCGSATKKRILREAFERNPRTIDLSPDNVPDLNVITGVFKDYLRELPEPLFTKHLYQMIVDALSVCMSDDPHGNAKLIFSLLDCLTKINRATLIFVMDHLSLVVSQVINNKMSPQNLSIIFAPLLMIKSQPEEKEIDFNQPINILRYLLEVWPSKSVREIIIGQGKVSVAPMVRPPPLPKKPSVVSVHGGGPLPVPSKGIRRPPPAVPARFTPVTAASLINDNSSSTSSSDGGGTEIEANTIARINGKSELYSNLNANELPSQLSFQSASRQGSAKEVGSKDMKRVDLPNLGYGSGSELRSSECFRLSPSFNAKTHPKQPCLLKNVNDDIAVTCSQYSVNDSERASQSNENEFVNGYSFQNINHQNSKFSCGSKTNSTKIEEALKQVSTCSKTIPSAFGHSRVDESCNSVEEIAKVNVSSWNDIVESWIKENENVTDGMVSSIGIKTLSHSHKNPFLADLSSSNDANTRGDSFSKSFANGFSFCVDSSTTPAVSKSNDAISDAGIDSRSDNSETKSQVTTSVTSVTTSSVTTSASNSTTASVDFLVDSNTRIKSTCDADSDNIS